MALSDNQKIIIVGIGALLVWHFFSGKNDPVATEENVQGNLEFDYLRSLKDLKQLQHEWITKSEDMKGNRRKFTRRPFDNIVERCIALKNRTAADKVYDRINKLKVPIKGYTGEDNDTFNARLRRHYQPLP